MPTIPASLPKAIHKSQRKRCNHITVFGNPCTKFEISVSSKLIAHVATTLPDSPRTGSGIGQLCATLQWIPRTPTQKTTTIIECATCKPLQVRHKPPRWRSWSGNRNLNGTFWKSSVKPTFFLGGAFLFQRKGVRDPQNEKRPWGINLKRPLPYLTRHELEARVLARELKRRRPAAQPCNGFHGRRRRKWQQ